MTPFKPPPEPEPAELHLTVEVDGSDVVQQEAPLHRVHAAADAVAAGTQVLVHAVQSVGDGVDGVDHKLDLPLLLVGRVQPDPLPSCRQTDPSHPWWGSPQILPSLGRRRSVPVHFFLSGSSLIPGRVSLHLKSSSQNSANQMFLRLFSRERDTKY